MRLLKAGFVLAGAMPLAATASAATLADCDDYRASVQAIAEPWEKNTRTYVGGAVRIVRMDTGGEPACCSVHLLVLATRPEDATGPAEVVCKVVSDRDRLGFSAADLKAIRAGYAPSRGLSLAVPVQYYVDGITARPGTVRIDVNLRTGVITAR